MAAIKRCGISFHLVEHQYCSTESIQEAEEIASIYHELQQQSISDDKAIRQIKQKDILIITPYNHQNTSLKKGR